MEKKRLLIIGSYNENYDRNKIIFESLEDKFIVTNINVKSRNKFFGHLSFIRNLFSSGRKNQYIFFVFPSYEFAFVIWVFKLFFNRVIIYDAFISIYDTHVLSNKFVERGSFKAFCYYFLDYISCYVAQIIIFDTKEHQYFFEKKFNIGQNKHKIVLPVAVDLELIDRLKPSIDRKFFRKDCFNVFFYGKYTALHGVEYIVKAASILKGHKNIKFILVGNGFFRNNVEKLSKDFALDNIVFLDKMGYASLIGYIKASDVCLGIFGKTDKAMRVIPNKILDYLVCGKLTITGKNNATESFFGDEIDIFYVSMANELELADKILYVYKNYEFLRNSQNSRKVIEKNFSKKRIKEIIEKEL